MRKFVQKHRKLSSIAVRGLMILAACVLLLAIYGSLVMWHHNRTTASKAASLVTTANQRATQNHGKPSVLPPDSAPSTVQPPADSWASYHVAPTLPRYITIPKLGVSARILAVGLASDGSIGTPSSVFDTAWYNKSSLPGQPGAMLIDGHISSWTTPGVFYHLDELHAGDSIQIERGDGQTYTYSVVKAIIYTSTDVDMSAVLSPITPGRPGLNLISCSGSVIHGTNDFNKRIVVFTSEK